MPRFAAIENIVFTNHEGQSFSVKGIRPISDQVTSFETDKNEHDLLDEIASRRGTFGEFGEIQSWRILDLNIVLFTENNFDMTKIKKVKVPSL